ncbi:MAG: hypothetical protein OK436_06230 [Thaumarchaeota archaeon]|nr:hypothetical protein [Nitrososphaerota archaeon]
MTDTELEELNNWMKLAGQRANTIEKQSNSLLRCARQIKKLESELRVWKGNSEFWSNEANRLRRGLERMAKELDEGGKSDGVRTLDRVGL